MGGPADAGRAAAGPHTTDGTVRVGLCLNNHGVHLLAGGRYGEACEVLEDAVHVLRSSGRAVPAGPRDRVLRRKLERAQRHCARPGPATASAPDADAAPRLPVHVISSEECLLRLGRLEILSQVALPAFRLEAHDDDLDYTSALLVHNLALARIGLGRHDKAARLLALSQRLLERCVRRPGAAAVTAPRAAHAAVLGLGALQRCYGELGAAAGLRACRDRLRRLRAALRDAAAAGPGPTVPVLAAAA